MESQGLAIRNLEIQMGQLATKLTERNPGSLPSNTEKKSKGASTSYIFEKWQGIT